MKRTLAGVAVGVALLVGLVAGVLFQAYRPKHESAGGVEAMLARLGERTTRERIRASIARDGLNNWGRIASWEDVRISISPHLPQFSGSTIASLAEERGAKPHETPGTSGNPAPVVGL